MNNNYYDDILEKINKALENNENQRALFYIEEEMSMPYIPMEFEEQLIELQKRCKAGMHDDRTHLSDEEIIEYLNGSPLKQIMAVNALNDKNIREYLDVVETYLKGEGDVKAKVLLINTLMEQDITEELTVNKDGFEIEFTPRYAEPVEISDGYNRAMEFFDEVLKQNPSVYQMAKDLLGQKCFMYLPLSYAEDEGLILAKEIICYIYDSLGDSEAKAAFVDQYLNDLEKKFLIKNA